MRLLSGGDTGSPTGPKDPVGTGPAKLSVDEFP